MKSMTNPLFALFVAATLAGCQTPPPPTPPQPHDGDPVLAVSVIAKTSAIESFTQGLKVKLEENAIRRHFTVAPNQCPDVTVEVSLSCRETARLQDWRTYEGDAEVRVVAAIDGKQIETTLIEGKGQRGADEHSALSSLADDLTVKVLSWLDKTVHPNRIAKLPALGN